METTVLCKGCKEMKPYSMFFKDASKPNGIRNYCKQCFNAAAKKRMEEREPIFCTTFTCSNCGETKDVSMFHKDSKKPKGIRTRCKACCVEWTKSYHENHRDEIILRKRKRRLCPAVQQQEKESYKEYYHRPEIKERYAEYRNRPEIASRYQDYRNVQENKKRLKMMAQKNKPVHNQRVRERYKSDQNYRLIAILRSRCRIHKTCNGLKTSYLTLLGCDIDFFKPWIEFRFDDNMNWDNLGTYWHLDHILPVNKFDFKIERSRHMCFHWTNLQPLPASENQSKRDKILPHYFFNNIVNVFRFNKKYKQFLGHEAISEMISWLGVKNPSIVTAPRIDKCK